MGRHKATIDISIKAGIFLDESKGKAVADASKNGNDEKLMEEPKWVDGKFGGALSFDTEGPFVRIELPTVQLSSCKAKAWSCFPFGPDFSSTL